MGKTFDPKQYNGLMSAETYCGQINLLPLLTPEEEFKLAARYRKYNDQESAHRLITSRPPGRRDHKMNRVCYYKGCGIVYGKKEPLSDKRTTHGLCPKHLKISLDRDTG